MTGGRVVILGPTGRNFGAGMSGGIAYVFDPHKQLLANCNLETIELDPVEGEQDELELRSLLENHLKFTGSDVAQLILDSWDDSLKHFVKVMPTDYKRVLAEWAAAEAAEGVESTEEIAASTGRS